jgi:hypothetical protein
MGSPRIELVRSGGFAGISRRWTEELSEPEAAEVERLFDRIADPASEPDGGADRFQYELRLTRDGRTRALTLREGAIPADIRPLLDRLTEGRA